MKLPIGFRFRPTDEELVVHYLRRKARSLPLPASVIPEFDVFHSDPWSLPGESSEKRYYFWKKKKKNKNGSICKVSAASRGYWKCNNSKGKGKHIVASTTISGSGTTERCGDDDHSTTGQVVVLGTRKTWTYYYYYRGKHNTTTTTTTTAPASKTRWVLHEFHLPDQNHWNPNCQMQDEEHDSWVVCRVFQRKKPTKCTQNNSKNNNNNNNIIEYSGFNHIHRESPSDIENCCTHQLRGSATPATTTTPLIPAASPCSSDITTEMEEEEALPGHGNDSTNNDDQDDSASSSSSSSPPPPCSY